MNWALRLYPRQWKLQYADEFQAVIEQGNWSLSQKLDVVKGAIDAHLFPQTSTKRRGGGKNIGFVILQLLALTVIAVLVGAAVQYLVPDQIGNLSPVATTGNPSVVMAVPVVAAPSGLALAYTMFAPVVPSLITTLFWLVCGCVFVALRKASVLRLFSFILASVMFVNGVVLFLLFNIVDAYVPNWLGKVGAEVTWATWFEGLFFVVMWGVITSVVCRSFTKKVWRAFWIGCAVQLAVVVGTGLQTLPVFNPFTEWLSTLGVANRWVLSAWTNNATFFFALWAAGFAFIIHSQRNKSNAAPNDDILTPA